ncbi:MAG: 30S ribosomal protein S19 [Candidatus Aenigmarchaeota archaeon]|nr:30S ribosomal protein S19 [Candidatus Aenigmarchaeota archaeon]
MEKKVIYKGKTQEELQVMSIKEFSDIITSRERRALKRGLTTIQKKLIKKVRKNKNTQKPIKTHARDTIILPEMIGHKFAIHNGIEFVNVEIKPQMIGHRLGEFAQTRRRVMHSSPGVGATRSSKFVPLK